MSLIIFQSLRYVPWRNWEEWECVKDNLFSSDPTLKWKAIRQISSWKGRGKVPISVEATANLVELFLKDVDQYYSWNKPSNYTNTEKRLAFSMILIRFVNLVLEPSQKSFFAQSIESLAKSVGLPQKFVDLRHAATHGQLPSLSILRSSCNELLNWNYENYWDLQKKTLILKKKSLVRSLQKYRNAKRKPLQENDQSLHILESIIKSYKNVREYLIPVLIENNFLVTKSNPDKEYDELPKTFIDLWFTALNYFTSFSPIFIGELLSSLSILITTETTLPKATTTLYACWISYILNEDTFFLNTSINLSDVLHRIIRLFLKIDFWIKWKILDLLFVRLNKLREKR